MTKASQTVLFLTALALPGYALTSAVAAQTKATTSQTRAAAKCAPVTPKNVQEALLMEASSNKNGCWERSANGKLIFISKETPDSYKALIPTTTLSIIWPGKSSVSAGLQGLMGGGGDFTLVPGQRKTVADTPTGDYTLTITQPKIQPLKFTFTANPNQTNNFSPSVGSFSLRYVSASGKGATWELANSSGDLMGEGGVNTSRPFPADLEPGMYEIRFTDIDMSNLKGVQHRRFEIKAGQLTELVIP